MKNNKVSFSVVIPMYNASETIRRAILSVLNQTYTDNILEIIVINDGSKDESENIVNQMIEENKSNINLILHTQENAGVSTARNKGMEMSKGTWIAFLDSDDAWYKDKIETQCLILNSNPNIQFLSGNMNSKPTKILFKTKISLFSPTIKDICITALSQPSTVIMSKTIYDEIGGFDVTQKYAEDGNYFLKVKANYSYYHNPIQCIEYGYDKRGFGQTGLSGNLQEMHKGNIKNLKETLKDGEIGLPFYIFCLFFYRIKYIRRIVISRVSK